MRWHLGCYTSEAEVLRRFIANQIEGKGAKANERNRQKIAQIRVKETSDLHATTLEEAPSRAQRARSATADLFYFRTE